MFEEVIGTSSVLQMVLARAAKVAPTDSTVLILGETGTGKELIARAIHKRSNRSERPFISLNCAAVPSSLIMSELFGHEKGAFTGALQRRVGRFELAEGGTLFLDEVGDLPPETQIALLRVLQEREFERVGGTEVLRADVRVIAATNRDLHAAVADGVFRSDLYYRLNVFPITLPPLRERKEDVPLLVNYFVDLYGKRAGRKIKHIQKKTLEALQEYSWPGNVRELQNVIERSLIIAETNEFSIDESWVADEPQPPTPATDRTLIERTLTERTLPERTRIEAALAQSNGKVSGADGAAAKLGMPPSTLESRIRSLGINKFQFKGALPTITGAIDEGLTITYPSLGSRPDRDSYSVTGKSPARLGPEKISIARLPVIESDIFGREDDIAFLDGSWANEDTNIVTIVAWAGVGKSTLINHWLRAMAAQHYRSAELVFGWSFYRQGTSGGTSSADEFLDAALGWFGDPHPQIGAAWEKGERLAKLISHRRTLLILDGLEPLQNPPGPQEGRLRDPSLQALLRELAAYNSGLCVITTRMPIADVADHEQTSVPRRDLEQLSSDAGAKLLRALGVRGDEAELRRASDEFSGHCLALTLLGSYLTDAYNGDIRCRKEVSQHLSHDVRQGVHARKVMESYQTWFGEGPELSVLRLLGLFDRPADEKALETLLRPPVIRGLTESLTNLSPSEWRTILAKLRRARLLAGEDPHNPGYLDAHPLVREYFGEQLRRLRMDAWKECNRRLFNHYRALAPEMPDNFREMEPLCLAVICGCNAGLFRQALHEVYIPRIQRGDDSFAANILGARGALLSVLIHFFEDGRWESAVQTGAEGQSLTADDQLFILIQAAVNMTAMRESAPEARICYERAESLCHSLNRPMQLYVALMGQCRSWGIAGNTAAARQFAKRLYSLAQEQKDSTLMIGACVQMAVTTWWVLGDFETSRQYTTRALQIWRSGGGRSPFQEVDSQPIACLALDAILQWHFGEIPSYLATIEEAISLAKQLNDMHGLAVVLSDGALLAHCERSAAEVERFASALIELSTRHSFAHWLAFGEIFSGWARSASGNTAEGLSWIEGGIEDYRASGSLGWRAYFLSLKAEALHFADRTSEALEILNEALALDEASGLRCWSAPFYRLRGVFLARLGADEAQIEEAFCRAIRTAKEQKSISWTKRAEATYAEYRRRKASAGRVGGFRLPIC